MLTVRLNSELEDLVRDKLDKGLYPDVDAMVEEAFRLLDQHDRLAYLRAAIAKADAQIDRGEFVEWTPDLMEQLSQEADEMERQGLQPHTDVCLLATAYPGGRCQGRHPGYPPSTRPSSGVAVSATSIGLRSAAP